MRGSQSIPKIKGRNRLSSVAAIALSIAVAAIFLGSFVAYGGLEEVRNWFLLFAALCALLFLMLPVTTDLLIFFAYLSVEGMLKLLTNYHPIVHIGADIILLFILIRWAGRKIITGEPFERPPFFGLIAFHTFWIMIQVFNPYAIGLIPSLGSFKVHLTMIPLYFVAYSATERERDLKAFVALQFLIGLVVWGTAIHQYLQGPDSVAWIGPAAQEKLWQFETYLFRPFGTTAVPGGPAMYSHLILPFVVIAFWIWRRWPMRVVLLILGILGILTLFICQSRQPLLLSVLGIVLAVMLAQRTIIRRGIAVACILLALFAGYLAAERLGGVVIVYRFATLLEEQTYTRSREGSFDAAIYNATHFPLGAGMGRIGAAAAKFKAELAQSPVPVRWSDTFPGQMLSEAGVPGFVFLSAILVLVVFQVYRAIRPTQSDVSRLMLVAIFGLLATYIPFSLTAQPLLAMPYTAYFWFLGGMAMKLRDLALGPVRG